MELLGKGMYVWKVPDCEGGNAEAIARAASEAGLSHVMVKIADGTNTYNYDKDRRVDRALPVIQALRQKGIQAWGWQYVYGDNPLGEARIAIRRIQELGVAGFVINAEAEYKQSGKDSAARKYMSEMRGALPKLPLALSSYRYPSYHPQLPWKDFLTHCDLNMPQVYWMQAHNPDTQLRKSVREFQTMNPSRPVFPTGSAFGAGGWAPTTGDMKRFMLTAQEMKLPGCNFWSWDYSRGGSLPGIWPVIADFPWAGGATPKDGTEVYVEALNSHDPHKMAALYDPKAIHVSATRTVQGKNPILIWYHLLFTEILPNATFELTGFSGTGTSRHMTWTAKSSLGEVLNGNDTFGLLGKKIGYHYTFFTVT